MGLELFGRKTPRGHHHQFASLLVWNAKRIRMYNTNQGGIVYLLSRSNSARKKSQRCVAADGGGGGITGYYPHCITCCRCDIPLNIIWTTVYLGIYFWHGNTNSVSIELGEWKRWTGKKDSTGVETKKKTSIFFFPSPGEVLIFMGSCARRRIGEYERPQPRSYTVRI